MIPLVWGMAASLAAAGEGEQRLVCLGSSVCEIVYALGAGDQVVGSDATALYPEALSALPRVGYYRALSGEGLLSLGPTMVIAPDDAGPPPALTQVEDAGVQLVQVASEDSADGARAQIRAVAEALGIDGEPLVGELDAALDEASSLVARASGAPRVMFVYARGAGALQVSGTGTAAAEMIRLAGGVNAVDGYEGYKPLTPESAVAAAPEVILLTSRGLESLGGEAALLATPGVALTPAGAEGRVVTVDDLLLLGFGPRMGEGVSALARAIHPELEAASP